VPTTPTTPTNEIATPRMYTRGDAMRILRIGETSLHWLTKTGKLPFVRIGARVLIPATEVERLSAPPGAGRSANRRDKGVRADTARRRRRNKMRHRQTYTARELYPAQRWCWRATFSMRTQSKSHG